MQTTAVPHAKLRLSQANVRTIARDAGLEALAASIAEHGLLQPLVVTPAKGRKALYDVHAGGRRWRAIGLLIERGLWPSDRRVDVCLLATGEASPREISLAENILREAMAPADEAQAYRDVMDEGADAAAVARRFGVTVRHVEGRLRLADLAPPIFAALAEGTITLDIAMAYGATADHARQLAVWQRLADTWQGDNPQAIRRALATDVLASDHPVALFLGEAEYEACGGRVERDLFSEAERGNWLDVDLAYDLALRKLTHEADVAALGSRLAWVRPCLATYLSHRETAGLEIYWPDHADPTPEALARIAAIDARMQELADCLDACPDGSEGALYEQEYDNLVAERERLQRSAPIIPDSDRPHVGTFLLLDSAGRPQLLDMYYRTPAEDPAGLDDDSDGCSAMAVEESAGAAAGGTSSITSGYSRALEEQLAKDRRDVLAFRLAREPDLALDLAMFVLACCVAKPGHLAATGCTIRLCDAADPKGLGKVPPSHAAQALASHAAGLPRSWSESEDAFQSFQAFRALDWAERLSWLALAVGCGLTASLASGAHERPFHTQLGAMIGIAVADVWRPTAEGFFDRLRKAQILDVLREIDPELPARHSASNKAELAGFAARLCAGETIVEAEVKQRALAWVPSALAFGAAPCAPSDGSPLEQDGEAPAQAA
jgi:ParB family chromosome partitioning protein